VQPPTQPAGQRIVDLTAVLGEETVLWPGSPPTSFRIADTIEEDGFFARELQLFEHAGTHLDAPRHFDPAGADTARIPPERLIVPCAVLDVAAEVGEDPELEVGPERIEAFEAEHGELPRGGALLLRTGWEKHWNSAAYLNEDAEGSLHFPGFAVSAGELFVERGLAGIGTDTLSVDPGIRDDFPLHHITLPAGMWHLECLVNLAELPPAGATLFVGLPRLEGGSGAPIRALALV
jgi:kynurenine formamidase